MFQPSDTPLMFNTATNGSSIFIFKLYMDGRNVFSAQPIGNTNTLLTISEQRVRKKVVICRSQICQEYSPECFPLLIEQICCKTET